MGLFYRSQDIFPLFGTKNAAKTITPVALTAAYTGNRKAFETGGYVKMNLDVRYTTGAAETDNSLNLLLEGSSDGVNWYQLVNESNSNGASTVYQREFTFGGTGTTAATAYALSYGIDVFYKYVRVSVKETGVAANAGSIFIEATLSGA